LILIDSESGSCLELEERVVGFSLFCFPPFSGGTRDNSGVTDELAEKKFEKVQLEREEMWRNQKRND